MKCGGAAGRGGEAVGDAPSRPSSCSRGKRSSFAAPRGPTAVCGSWPHSSATPRSTCVYTCHAHAIHMRMAMCMHAWGVHRSATPRSSTLSRWPTECTPRALRSSRPSSARAAPSTCCSAKMATYSARPRLASQRPTCNQERNQGDHQEAIKESSRSHQGASGPHARARRARRAMGGARRTRGARGGASGVACAWTLRWPSRRPRSRSNQEVIMRQ